MTSIANLNQAEYWNGDAGAAWVKHQERLDAVLAPFTEASLMAMGSIEMLRVLDVGCGCGESTEKLAERQADVTGLDISEPMIAHANRRNEKGRALHFVCGDAATYQDHAGFDRIYSRFGCMFFEDPVAAFAHLRHLLRGKGSAHLMCWQSPRHNPWMAIAGRAIAPFLPEQPARDPKAPGPFAFSDQDYVNAILEQAGFTEINFESLQRSVCMAPSVSEAIAFQMDIGPAARALRTMDETTREKALGAIHGALLPYQTDAGVEMSGAVWLIRAS